MTTIMQDRVRSQLVLPPANGPLICPRCRTWNDAPSAPECSNCAEVESALGLPALHLSVVTLYRKPSLLRDWLTHYKGRENEPEPLGLKAVEHVQALVDALVEHAGERLNDEVGSYDVVVVVPSTERPPPHPLEALLVKAGLGPVRPLLVRGEGDLGFRRPSRTGFAVEGHLRPSTRILLVDDVYTTGSRINSAAYALRGAGAHIAAAMVLARRVNPDYDEVAGEMWATQQAVAFDWEMSPHLEGLEAS